MRFNVADLLKAPTGHTLVVEVDEAFNFAEMGVQPTAPLSGRLKLIRDYAGVLVQGRLDTTMALVCARCLEPIEVAVSFELTEEFRPTVYIPGGPQLLPPSERDAATEIDEHHVLDLSEVIRQNLAVALPWNAVCRPDCAGLCPTCGANWNNESCDCEPEPDPRWADLRALIDEDSQ